MKEEKKKTKKESIAIKKSDLWKYSTFILIAIIVVGAIVLFAGDDKSPSRNTNTNPGERALPMGSKSQTSPDDDPVLGDKSAPVTIIEFSDYECPYCSMFWSETLPAIKENYIDKGKVKLVYRDYPLGSHKMAQPAAEAAECVRDAAGRSDKAYFEMHDKIFSNQQSLSVDNLKKWAKDLGYDIGNCLDSGKFADEVRKDVADGGRLGTPTFFINGKQLRGAQPFESFKRVIDAELS